MTSMHDLQACMKAGVACESGEEAMDRFARCACNGLTGYREAMSVKTVVMREAFNSHANAGILDSCRFSEVPHPPPLSSSPPQSVEGHAPLLGKSCNLLPK